jgi:hypothetical protein
VSAALAIAQLRLSLLEAEAGTQVGPTIARAVAGYVARQHPAWTRDRVEPAATERPCPRSSTAVLADDGARAATELGATRGGGPIRRSSSGRRSSCIAAAAGRS